MKKFKGFKKHIMSFVIVMFAFFFVGGNTAYGQVRVRVNPVRINMPVHTPINTRMSASSPSEVMYKTCKSAREMFDMMENMLDIEGYYRDLKNEFMKQGLKVPEQCYSQEDKDRMESIKQRNANGEFIGVDDLVWFSKMMGTTVQLRDSVREMKKLNR